MDSPVLLSQMLRRLGPSLFLLVAALFSCVSWVSATVTYDHKALVIDGQRKILMSGSIHYPRSTPQMWPDLIQKAKDGGLDVIETYVFWSGHEPSPGKYDFGDRFDLVRFIKLVQDAGLYVHLRIGPYACAEWNFGGFPVWLKFVPGIAFRTDNEPFKMAMQRFTEKIVKMMKQEKLFQPQGGPIILCQIENEYGIFEQRYGKPGRAYVNWAASMALNLSTGVPWVMCKQADAPGPVINTCNGFYCHDFLPNRNDKPKMWTELWTAWYSAFNRPVPHRSVEDIAFAVARFIQNNGSLVNYYMYHGGTNFGRTTGGPFVATSYDYDAPIDEYGLIRQPKWGHLQELHKAIKQCEGALVSVDPQVLNLGNNNTQEAHVFESDSAGCAAFLANYDAKASQKVAFREKFYVLPRWSVSILPDCKTEAFNTARVTAKSSQIKMNPVNIGALSWQSYKEQIASALDLDAVPMTGLQEQISVTKDRSDYMWYLTTVEKDSAFLNGADPVLTIKSAGHGLHVFINGQLSGTVYGSTGHANITFQKSVHLIPGVNNISLLSVAVGLPNIGFKFETWPVGVLGPVTLGTEDLTTQKWYYKVGLKGEALSLYSPRAHWPKRSPSAENQPLMWYKTTFAAPDGNEPLAIDMNNMTKGQIWVNGNAIGRYWPSHTSGGSCGGPCNYAGTYSPGKCARSCGEDNRNHVPRSWLKKTGNTLVVFEETGGNTSGITFAKRTTVQESEHSTGQICGFSHLQTANKSCSK